VPIVRFLVERGVPVVARTWDSLLVGARRWLYRVQDATKPRPWRWRRNAEELGGTSKTMLVLEMFIRLWRAS